MSNTTTNRGRGRTSNTTIKGITKKTTGRGTTRFEARVTIPSQGTFETQTIYIGSANSLGGAVNMRNEFIKQLF